MFKNCLFFLLILPLAGFAQYNIAGRVINHAGKKPVADASIFLGNASVGGKTNNDGTFTLHNAKPGKYNLIVSVVGFETYSQTIVVDNANITLPADVEISPKEISLHEVSITAKRTRDAFKSRNYEWFKREFLGTSYLAINSKIINPQVLELSYDDDTHTLTGSSRDFLEIQNDALGYKIKYLLANFTMDNTDEDAVRVHYEGSALFEKMNGTPGQLKRWQNARQEVYEGSEMHFLRSALADRFDENGFRVLQVTAKHTIFRKRDSLSYHNLGNTPLSKKEIISPTTQPGLFALNPPSNALHITYNKKHHFGGSKLFDLNNKRNTDVTVLNLAAAYALFDKNGGMADPNSVSFYGAWGHNRMAELLPLDYEPQQNQEQKRDSTETAIVTLKNFLEEHVTEKAYLHFDKPYYAAGDTIYFKAYVTRGEQHQLSDLSGVLHADLINTVNKIDQSLKLQVVGGVAWGDFALPDSLPKGDYRVRAYTQWMRNEGNYFDRDIQVGSVHNNTVPESAKPGTAALKAKPDIQLLPEGGEMVAGIRTKVAFKAIDGDGRGVDIKGVVTDGENNEVTTFASSHLGMGYFYLTPQPGKTYKARLTYADGSQNMIDLPKAVENGMALSVNNDSLAKAVIKIETSNTFYKQNKNKEFSLLIYSAGTAIPVSFTLDKPSYSMDILKRKLQTGIATVTLFSPLGQPLGERLLFIQKYDQLNIQAASDKSTNIVRGKTNIRLNVKTRADAPSMGHFSVSVVDENKVPTDENTSHTVLTDLLLTSDLKGYIEQPNYYFTNVSDKTAADLDLVMLTHGYRKFEWKALLNNEYPALAWQPEKGLEITGTAKSILLGKPLAKGIVSLIKKKDGSFLRDTTDEKGHFHFRNLVFTDTDKFILQAIKSTGKDNTKLVVDKDGPGPVINPAINPQYADVNQTLSAYMDNDKLLQDDIAKYGTLNGRMLKGVTIKDQKIKKLHLSSSSLVGPEFADQVITPDQMAKGGPFAERIQGVLRGIIIRRRIPLADDPRPAGNFAYLKGGGLRMRVILDAVDTDGNLDEIDASDVESVEVLRFGGAMGVYSGLSGSVGINKDGTDGILIINTRKNKGLQLQDIASIGILPIAPKGFYIAREFYSPKYDHPELKSGRPDLRSTIFWQPELITDKNGNASFEYNNADGRGTYRITVEGIDDNGNLGTVVYKYKVD